jgi:PAS domain S-box-containing protein
MRRSGKNGERAEEVRGDKKRPAKVEPLRPQAKGEMICEPIARIKERFGDILQNLSDLIWEVDENCVFTWCSGAAKDIFGVAAGELIGKRPFDFMPAEEAQRTKNIIEEMSLKKEPIKNLEAYHEDKRGRRHWLCVNAIPILDNKGTLKGYMGVCRDITSQKKAEESLRESELKFRMLADEAFDGIAIHDGQRIIEVNKAFGILWGYTPGEAAGLRNAKLFAPECWGTVKKNIQSGYDKPYETVAIRKDGTRFPIEVAGKSIIYKGRTMRIATTRDITERKQAEQKLLEDKKQLKQLTSQLALTEERERRRIAGKLHDQLCQSLALAKIRLDAIRSSGKSKPVEEELMQVSDAMQSLIDQTRSLVFDLSSPILYELGFEAAVAEWLNEQVRDKGGIETEFQDDHLPKPLDDDVRVLLFRNIRELLINVIKHSRASKVKVSIRRADDSIEITVEDNGIGFNPAEANTMAAKTAKFGLFSIRESMEQLGGRFEIESKPDAGCKATIAAPLKDTSHKKEEN